MTEIGCEVPQCPRSEVKTSDTRSLFRHYLTHLQVEIENVAIDLGIPTFQENRLSLINAIIEFSRNKVKKH